MSISSDYQQELRKKYNPDGSPLRKAQLRMTEMLLFFDSFCRKHHLVYWIDAGTLLGAVRHGGFIPWDDDADVLMPEKDFFLLKRIMLNERENDDFVLQCHETDPGFFGAWIVLRDKKSECIQDSNLHRARKYRGLQVDIVACTNRFIWPLYWFCGQYQYFFINKPLQKNNDYTHIPFKIKTAYHIFHFLFLPFFRFISRPFTHKYIRYNYGVSWKSHCKIENIYPTERIVFENIELSAPHNPEGYLTDEYGEWRTIPSEDKIRTHQLEVIFK